MQSRQKPVFDEYAIFQTGGKQYQAIPGKTLEIEKIEGEEGTNIDFNDVLFLKKGTEKFEFGTPYVEGAAIKASIIKQIKGKKVIVFKFKRRKHYRVKTGHRQMHTVIRIESI